MLDGARADRRRRADAHAGPTAATLHALTLVADELRRRQVGDVVTYVVNRNINFTNVCIKHCTFCAFSRDHREEEGYFLPVDEVVRRAQEAADLGATEVCIQAGLPPKLDGRYYIDLTRAIKRALPAIHIHAFSPGGGAVRLGALRAADPRLPGRAAGRGARHAAGHVRRDPRPGDPRRHRARSHHGGRSGSTSSPPRTPSGSARRRRSCTATWRRPRTGSVTWPCCARSRRTRAASRSSCRSRSSTRRRRCTRRGSCPTCGRARPGSRSCSMHALARLMLGPTFRNIQSSWVKEGPKLAQLPAHRRAPTTSAARSSTSPSRRRRAPSTDSWWRRRSCAGSSATPGAIPAQRDTLYGIIRRLRRRRGGRLAPRQDRGRRGALRLVSATDRLGRVPLHGAVASRGRPVVLMHFAFNHPD